MQKTSVEDINIPLKIEEETAKGALALVQYSRAQKQVFQKVFKTLQRILYCIHTDAEKMKIKGVGVLDRTCLVPLSWTWGTLT